MSQKEPTTKKNAAVAGNGAKPLQFRRNGPALTECWWRIIDAELMVQALDAATQQGAAIIFGLTSDGGAYSICVLDDANKAKEYPHGKQECEDVLRQILEHYE